VTTTNLRYHVRTNVMLHNGDIEQCVEAEGFDGIRERLFFQLIHTREQAIHDALVSLGWTPPREVPPPVRV
jgi:hypothetical protein